MNSLLLHNDKVPTKVIDKFSHNEKLVPSKVMLSEDNFDYDVFYHKELTSVFEGKEYDVIYISLSLSDYDYLEMGGLRVAHHIRLTKEWKHIYTPIYFICQEEPMEIMRLNPLGKILLTKGVYLTNDLNVPVIKSPPLISEREYLKLLEKFETPAPANYQSHHSVDNELALLRWSEYLGCDDKISDVIYNLQAGLFFKHYMAEHPITKAGSVAKFFIEGKAKILLIDDESEKGWDIFYKHLFGLSNGISFESLNIDYKFYSRDKIIEMALDKIKELNPDVVLLDLRLNDDDFKEKTIYSEFTGVQVLKGIKNINNGIQVIITTASNKVWNFQTTLEFGANGYIIKDGERDVSETIKKTRDIIEISIDRAKWLKVILSDMNEIIQHVDKNRVDKDLADEIKNQIRLSYSLVEDATTKERFAFAYISLNLIVEIINKSLIEKKSDDEWFIVKGEKLKNWTWSFFDRKYLPYKIADEEVAEDFDRIDNKDVEYVVGYDVAEFKKVAGLVLQKWNQDDHDFIRQIAISISKRNGFVHNDKKILDKPQRDNEGIIKKDRNKKIVYQNHDIYEFEGFLKLLKLIKKFVGFI